MAEPRPKVITINRNPGDFLRDTQHLSALEIGCYNLICDNIVVLGQEHDPPSLPDDDDALANICKLDVKSWRRIKARLCTGPLAVLILEGGFISQARTVEEIEAARVRIIQSSQAGVKSGEARRRKSDALRERMLNGGSNGGSTDVRRSFKASSLGPSNPSRTGSEREANGKRTTHESRNTKLPTETSSPPVTPADAGDLKRAGAREAVESFEPSEKQREWAAKKAPSVPIDEATEAWKDRMRSNGYRTNQGPLKDAAAGWRLHMTNAELWGTYKKAGGNGTGRRGDSLPADAVAQLNVGSHAPDEEAASRRAEAIGERARDLLRERRLFTNYPDKYPWSHAFAPDDFDRYYAHLRTLPDLIGAPTPEQFLAENPA